MGKDTYSGILKIVGEFLEKHGIKGALAIFGMYEFDWFFKEVGAKLVNQAIMTMRELETTQGLMNELLKKLVEMHR